MFHKVFALLVSLAATVFLAANGAWEVACAAGIFLMLWVIVILKPEGLEEEDAASDLCTCPAKEPAGPCMCRAKEE